ncbi:DUF6143 family protein [Romboutsia sp.]|uniref:DUF6143 family protein n=1 Tax=Romboutsia sp. TaxID=1965302 RepID=UPI002CDDAB23|nr:DUF6143 family protein [Romboutsia sp.]HSQ88263.1 DUF6143 family protein [Romboutsia sp.]
MTNSDKKIDKTVSIPYDLYESKEGNYFIGQTPILTGEGGRALGALVNPCNSGVNIYVNVITVTNISELSLSAEIYLKYKVKGGLISDLVSSANLAFNPDPTPKGQIKYLNTATEAPSTSIAIFTRIVSPSSTLVIDGSQIIIPPGESLVVYLGGILPIEQNSTKVAFGWWEDEISNHCKCYDYSKPCRAYG